MGLLYLTKKNRLTLNLAHFYFEFSKEPILF
jgi:hypothetical protein